MPKKYTWWWYIWTVLFFFNKYDGTQLGDGLVDSVASRDGRDKIPTIVEPQLMFGATLSS